LDLAIDGKVALVTGASEGLGLASAAALAAEGAEIVITGRRVDKLELARSELEERTGKVALVIQGDITEPDEPARVIDLVVAHFGRLDILVANAGGPPAQRALEVTDDEVIAAINANLLTTVRLVRAARPQLRATGDGRICCITSYSVLQPIPELALSNLARAGLWGWAKTAARDLVAEGVTLNLICPGPHRTARMATLGMQDRAGDPTDFGRAVAFLCSTTARFITATTLVVDGGATLGL
jgi:3-oxoacyl-[acyl-carrier protein] reductase